METTVPLRLAGRDRAVSAVVGLVLLFGLVVAGAGMIFVTGMDAKQTMTETSEIASAESAMQEIGSDLSTLSMAGEDATARVEMSPRQAKDLRVADGGTIRFQLNGKTACTAERDLGSMVYEHDSGVVVAYQAGGVFKQTTDGTTIVQSPQLEYQTERIEGHDVRTVQFPVTNVSGSVDSGRDVVASRDGSASGDLETDLCLTGPNDDKFEYVREVTITVEDTDYYEAWHRYFEDEFGSAGDYSIDHDDQSASVTAPLGAGLQPSQFTLGKHQIYGAIFSTASSSGELLLQTKHASIDSYDSSMGPWGGSEPSYGAEGDILTRGDVAVQANGAQIAGDVYAEGEVHLSESCGSNDEDDDEDDGEYCVDGTVYVNNTTASGTDTSLYPDEDDDREEVITDGWDNGTTVPSIPPMDDEIERPASVVRRYNDNDAVSVVDAKQIQFSGGSATVESGVYYLDELTVPAGKDLELDTSDGDVVLVVEGDVDVGSDATVSVTGDGQVRAFVNETTTDGDQLRVREGATVQVTDGGTRTYRPEALFVACKAGCSATFDDTPASNPTTFTGVLYGPGETADDGSVHVGKRVDVWGALVAGSVTMEQQSNFHFDTQLLGREVDSDDDGKVEAFGPAFWDDTVKNGYVISVTANDVNVSSGDETPKLGA